MALEQPAAKRKPGEQHGQAAGNMEWDSSALFAEIRAEVNQQLNAGLAAVEARFNAGIGKQLAAMEAESNRRLTEHELLLADVRARVGRLEDERVGLQRTLTALSAGLAAAEAPASQVPIVVDTTQFDREIDTTILKVRAAEVVAKVAVQAFFSDMVQRELGLDGAAVVVEGDAVSKFFTAKFKGNGGLAEGRVRKFVQLQRSVDGKWRTFTVPDEHGTARQIFIDGDKNKKQIRTEVVTKKLCQILATKTQQQLFGRRSEGKIYHAWMPVAKVEMQGPGSQFRMLWNNVKVEELGLIKEQILAELETACASPADNVSWG